MAVFVQARKAGLCLDILDIGGGFPTPYQADVPAIEAFCQRIRFALNAVPTFVRVLAEPGRYLAAPVIVSVATVVGKAKRGSRFWYYLDDGVYGSYSGKIYDHASYPLSFVTASRTDLRQYRCHRRKYSYSRVANR